MKKANINDRYNVISPTRLDRGIKRILYSLILILPFLGMIGVNEFVRSNIEDEGYKKNGITAINSSKKLTDKCTWNCHNDTNYCKKNHVKLVNQYFENIDPIYFGIIRSLKSTGNYGLANIIFLVILIPMMMYFLLTKSISMQLEIRKLNKNNLGNE